MARKYRGDHGSFITKSESKSASTSNEKDTLSSQLSCFYGLMYLDSEKYESAADSFLEVSVHFLNKEIAFLRAVCICLRNFTSWRWKLECCSTICCTLKTLLFTGLCVPWHRSVEKNWRERYDNRWIYVTVFSNNRNVYFYAACCMFLVHRQQLIHELARCDAKSEGSFVRFL